jgi:hypothetical protein
LLKGFTVIGAFNYVKIYDGVVTKEAYGGMQACSWNVIYIEQKQTVPEHPSGAPNLTGT